MKIIVSSYFERIFQKLCKKIDLKELSNQIKIDSKWIIYLKYPFVKVKLKLNSKAYRLIIYYKPDKEIIVCVNVFEKKDKKYWDNLNWRVHKKDIMKWYEENLKDIQQWKYKKFII